MNELTPVSPEHGIYVVTFKLINGDNLDYSVATLNGEYKAIVIAGIHHSKYVKKSEDIGTWVYRVVGVAYVGSFPVIINQNGEKVSSPEGHLYDMLEW